MNRHYSPGVEEDSFCEGCFARVDMRTDANVAYAGKTLCVSGWHVLVDCFLRDEKAWGFWSFLFYGKLSGGLPSYQAGPEGRGGCGSSRENMSDEGTAHRETMKAMATAEKGASQGFNSPP